MSKLEPCPNHAGAWDCSPFCELCQGSQEYDPAEIIFCRVITCDEELTKATYAEEFGFCVDHSHAYFNQELDPYTLERMTNAN